MMMPVIASYHNIIYLSSTAGGGRGTGYAVLLYKRKKTMGATTILYCINEVLYNQIKNINLYSAQR